MASGRLQTLCYKEEIESALRTPGMGGFELLDLHDFPGQGTALVGVLDPFWESKGYVTAEEYRRFCNSTVLLARLPRRVFTSADTLEAGLAIAHFGPAAMRDAAPSWELLDQTGAIRGEGTLESREIATGDLTELGRIRFPLAHLAAPARYRLLVKLEGTAFENDWDIWVYPAHGAPPAEGVLIADSLTDATLSALSGGRDVLLLIPPDRVRGDSQGKVALGFSTVFWNTSWTGRQEPHTLGILCDPAHPALSEFPTEYHSNYQWWYLIHQAGAMVLDHLGRETRPIVQVIDDWFTNRKLGLVLEGRLGKGRVIVTSIDLRDLPGQNPVARQMRTSLLHYMASDRFRPDTVFSVDAIRRLFAE
jgi:hypothetical protein